MPVNEYATPRLRITQVIPISPPAAISRQRPAGRR